MKKSILTGIIILFVLCLLYLIFLNFPKTSIVENCNDCRQSYIENAFHKRDSLVINYTVNSWIDSAYAPWFASYKSDFAGKKMYYKIHVDKIFYDTAYLKLMAFVYMETIVDSSGIAQPGADEHADTVFDSYTIAGYRDHPGQIWKLCEFNEVFQGRGSPTLESAVRFHESYFLCKKRMAEVSVGVYLPGKKKWKTDIIEYTPCEPGFWTKSPLWQKGYRVPGYYIFETYMNATVENPSLIEEKRVVYPDSILNLYKNE
jgi:hypothetical protein